MNCGAPSSQSQNQIQTQIQKPTLNCDDNNNSSDFYMPFADFTTLLAPGLCRTQTNCGALMAMLPSVVVAVATGSGATVGLAKSRFPARLFVLEPFFFPVGDVACLGHFLFHGIRRQNGVACCHEMFVENCSKVGLIQGSEGISTLQL